MPYSIYNQQWFYGNKASTKVVHFPKGVGVIGERNNSLHLITGENRALDSNPAVEKLGKKQVLERVKTMY